ncbi:response regulator [Echinicola jeungdonensis]|uniref:histidine kinase n=1 Tax=Echinicola jeungdonensis TaxID=709343 RepID=A0ABV5J0Q6_9BACT|nr:response regulator [Echinicola jeungdonensis]MDN3667843.1 response regulator [Echinicola jeungdonensis]
MATLNQEGKIDSLNKWSEEHMERDLNQALKNCLVALELSKKINYTFGKTESMINLGWIYYRMDNFVQAMDYAFKGHQNILKSNNKKLIVRSYINIGAIYNEAGGQWEQSLKYFKNAYQESLSLDNPRLEGRALNNVAYTYVQLKDYDSALDLVIPFLSRTQTPSMEAFARRTLGDIQLAKKDTAQALENYTNAYEILKKELSHSTQVSCITRLAAIFLNQGELYKAKLLLDKGLAISEKNNFQEHKAQINDLISHYYQKLGNWEAAFRYKNKYAELADSLGQQVNSQNMGRLEAKFDFDQKLEAINTEMALSEKLINEKLEQQILRRNIFLAGFILMLFFTTIIFISRKRIRKSKKIAESANKAKSEFISSMSHEIRTPLNGVIGFSDLLSGTKLDSTQRQYTSLINQSAKSLMEIVNDILDFSKIEAGKLEIELAQTDIYNLGLETVNLIAYQAHKKNIELILNIEEDIPKYVMADQVRIKQILINLLSNAVKFTKEGEIELKIEKLNSSEPETSKIRFLVRDTGRGISKQNQEKIFEPFTQEDSSTTRKFGGTGLGLAISRSLLEMMESKLQLDSKMGKGSTFWCDISVKNIIYHKEENIKLLPQQLKTLVVEDVKAQAKVILKILKQQNIQAHHAFGEKDTLELLRSGEKYDFLLVDYQLENTDGIKLIRKLKNQLGLIPSSQKVILMHNSFTEDMNISGEIPGFLIKPIKKHNLIQTINNFYKEEDKSPSPSYDQNIIEDDFAGLSPNILIAEDNPVNMLLTKRVLISLIPNARFLEAKNGLEAVKLYQDNEVDLVFMDIQMPQLNGYEATESIRKLETIKRVPIIALTAGILNNERQKCLDAGLDDYTPKPMNKITIKKLIFKWLIPKAI